MVLFLLLLASGSLVDAQDTGFGCYSIDTNRCTCTADVCSEMACLATGGFWTPDCVSCQCAEVEAAPEDESPTEEVEMEAEETEAPALSIDDEPGNFTAVFGSKYGCFGLPSSPFNCDCSEEVCSKDSCAVSPASFRTFTQDNGLESFLVVSDK